VKTRNGASKTLCKINDRNQLRKQFISSQTFHRTLGGRVRKITAKDQFKPRNLESFNPVTQESYRHRFLQQSTSHTSKNPLRKSDIRQQQRKILRQETEAPTGNLYHKLVLDTTNSTGIDILANRKLQIEKVRMR
jgi:hypothetical protein